MRTSDQETLWLQAKTPEAVDALLVFYEPMLLSLAKRVADVPLDDCLQEARIALVSAIHHYDATKGVSFASYAGVCVRNRMRALAQRQRRTAPTAADSPLVEDEAAGPEDKLLSQEALAEATAAAKKRLSSLEYAVWRLRIDGYRYEEIAEVLSRPDRPIDVKCVNNALCRVRKKLR